MIAIAILALAPAAVSAAISNAAILAPPLDVPIRVVNERAEGEWHFRMERLVRFSREGEGYRAEVWMVGATATGPDRVASMMEAGFAGLAGRTMVFHLDSAGTVTAIDDLPTLWTRFCDGIAEIVKTRRPDAESMIGPLRTLPAPQRTAMLASLVTALIAEEAGEPEGSRPVRIPAKSPYGGQLSLTGTRRIERLGITRRSTTRAEADATGTNGPAHVEAETIRDADPATGLITTTQETVRTRIGTTATQRVSTVRVTIEPATAWPAK